MSVKQDNLIKLIREIEVISSQDAYNINGIDIGKAIFFYRKSQELFDVLPKGSYRIDTAGGNTNIVITDTEILGTAEKLQIGYIFTTISSKYEPEFDVDTITLKDRYNECIDDMKNIYAYIKKSMMIADSDDFSIVLPTLKSGEVWIKTDEGWKGTNVADLEKLVNDLVDRINNIILPEFEKQLEEIINKMLVADYVDLPYMGKEIVQIYIDTENNVFRECDNTKVEPLSAVGLRFIKEDGTIITRCYFRGRYKFDFISPLQNGTYWQDPTVQDGLTLQQPKVWKSLAFEIVDNYIYFDRGNPILLQGELGSIVFKEYETLDQARADSQLIKGELVFVAGENSVADGKTGIYIKNDTDFDLIDITTGSLEKKLDKGNYTGTAEELKSGIDNNTKNININKTDILLKANTNSPTFTGDAIFSNNPTIKHNSYPAIVLESQNKSSNIAMDASSGKVVVGGTIGQNGEIFTKGNCKFLKANSGWSQDANGVLFQWVNLNNFSKGKISFPISFSSLFYVGVQCTPAFSSAITASVYAVTNNYFECTVFKTTDGAAQTSNISVLALGF